MDPDKKQLIIMLGIVGILLIVVGMLVFWPSTSGSNSPQPPLTLRGGDVVPPLSVRGGLEGLETPPTPLKPTPDQQDAAAMLALARSFAELFGTYSSEAASFSNVNLADLATPSFQKWLAVAWPKLRAGFPKGTYYSMTARSLSTKTVSHDPVGGKASVEVQVQREELGIRNKELGIRDSVVGYRTLQLELVRQDGHWLVERASWK